MELVDILLSAPDEISLDEVCDDVKYDLGIVRHDCAVSENQEVKDYSLTVVHRIMERRLRSEVSRHLGK